MSEPTLTLRAYRPADQPVCLALFDSNRPLYFHASERAEYAEFLGDPANRGEYWVMERGETVVACGGVWVNAEGLAGLSWGMVRGDLHGQGLGTRLTVYRLEWLRLRPEVWRVRLDTSQHTEAFYAKQEFVAVQRTPEGFAPGLDEVTMVLDVPGQVQAD